MLDIKLLKNELISAIKPKGITTVLELWGHAKHYYNSKGREMGGGFASIGTDITVRLNVADGQARFKVSLAEVSP